MKNFFQRRNDFYNNTIIKMMCTVHKQKHFDLFYKRALSLARRHVTFHTQPNNTIIKGMDGHRQKHFDDFVLQKELSLSSRRYVACRTHNLACRERERERERERDRPLRDDYAFTRACTSTVSAPILSILCASYSSMPW